MRRKKNGPDPAAGENVSDIRTSSDQNGTAVFTITDLADEFGTTLRTLRFYEQRGLIRPEREGNRRLYSAEDRARLALVQQGKRLGFTLGEIGAMLAAREGSESLDLNRRTCLDQIRLLERQKRDIEQALLELRQIYSSFYVESYELASD